MIEEGKCSTLKKILKRHIESNSNPSMSTSCQGVPGASAIDKLVTVSKIFADQRVSELINEYAVTAARIYGQRAFPPHCQNNDDKFAHQK